VEISAERTRAIATEADARVDSIRTSLEIEVLGNTSSHFERESDQARVRGFAKASAGRGDSKVPIDASSSSRSMQCTIAIRRTVRRNGDAWRGLLVSRRVP
jgi:hypothetical protein